MARRRVVHALARFAGGLALASCSGDGRPSGFHSPNAVIASDELGLVWLNHGLLDEGVLFLRAHLDARAKGSPILLSTQAHGSDPPLVASDGRGYLAVWTHDREPTIGIHASAIDPHGASAPERVLVPGSATLCRQLVWTGRHYALAWHDGAALRLGVLASADASPNVTASISASGIGACRLTWTDAELAVAWVQGDDRESVAIARLSAEGTLLGQRSVALGPGAPLAAIDLVWHGDGYTLVGTPAARSGLHVVELSPALGERRRVHGFADRGHLRGIALAPSRATVVLFSEFANTDTRHGTAQLALLGPEGPEHVRALGTPRHTRAVVNADATDSRAVLTWSDNREGGTVSWLVLSWHSTMEAASVVQEIYRGPTPP